MARKSHFLNDEKVESERTPGSDLDPFLSSPSITEYLTESCRLSDL